MTHDHLLYHPDESITQCVDFSVNHIARIRRFFFYRSSRSKSPKLLTVRQHRPWMARDDFNPVGGALIWFLQIVKNFDINVSIDVVHHSTDIAFNLQLRNSHIFKSAVQAWLGLTDDFYFDVCHLPRLSAALARLMLLPLSKLSSIAAAVITGKGCLEYCLLNAVKLR